MQSEQRRFTVQGRRVLFNLLLIQINKHEQSKIFNRQSGVAFFCVAALGESWCVGSLAESVRSRAHAGSGHLLGVLPPLTGECF